MPLGKIELRELTPTEQTWRAGWLKWEGHEVKDMVPTLWHMSRDEYISWLYAIDPRTALVLCNEPGFREIREYQLKKRWYHEVRDRIWRKFYGTV